MLMSVERWVSMWLLASLARVLAGGDSSPWLPRIGAASTLTCSAPRRRLPALLVLGILLMPLRRSALLPLLSKIWCDCHGSSRGSMGAMAGPRLVLVHAVLTLKACAAAQGSACVACSLFCERGG